MSLATNKANITIAASILLFNEAMAVPSNPLISQNAQSLPNQEYPPTEAKSFVANELSLGLLMNKAMARFKRARAAYRKPISQLGMIICSYAIKAGPTDDDLHLKAPIVRLIAANDTMQNDVLGRITCRHAHHSII